MSRPRTFQCTVQQTTQILVLVTNWLLVVLPLSCLQHLGPLPSQMLLLPAYLLGAKRVSEPLAKLANFCHQPHLRGHLLLRQALVQPCANPLYISGHNGCVARACALWPPAVHTLGRVPAGARCPFDRGVLSCTCSPCSASWHCGTQRVFALSAGTCIFSCGYRLPAGATHSRARGGDWTCVWLSFASSTR